MADGLPIGVRIARRRQALGMRQEDLARKLGVSRAAVSNWEAGKHFPKRKQGLVEAVLGISLDAEPQADIVPDEVRKAIKRTLPPDRAAQIEAVVEAALRGDVPPKREEREPSADAG